MLPGDSLLTFDRSLQRLSLFDAQGELVTTARVSAPGAPPLQEPVNIAGSADLLTMAFVGQDPSDPGPYFVSQVVGVYDRELGTYHALDTVGGAEAALVEREGRLVPAIVPFGRKSDFAASAEHVYVMDGRDETTIRVYAVDGYQLVRLLRFVFPRPEIDQAMTDRWVASFLEKNRHVFADERVAEMWRYGFSRVSPPARIPPFRSLEVDQDGDLCAERYGPTEVAPPEFWCFTPLGEYVRSVVLPSAPRRTGFPHQDPQLGLGGDDVLGVWEDELGIQSVRAYPLRPAGRGSGRN